MKKILYISVVLGALLLFGCVEEEKDFYIDSTGTASIVHQQTLSPIKDAAALLVSALNLNEYIECTTDEERQKVEDKYYTYKKIRRDGDACLVYEKDYLERYLLADGKTLGQNGAVWTIEKHSGILGNTQYSDDAIRIALSATDEFRLTFDAAKLYYTDSGRYYNSSYFYFNDNEAAFVDAVFDVAANNTAFRSESAENLTLTISGSGKITDTKYPTYYIDFDITAPLVCTMDASGEMLDARTITGTLVMTVNDTSARSSEKVVAEMSKYNLTKITYTTAKGTYVGYYDITGNDIRPTK